MLDDNHIIERVLNGETDQFGVLVEKYQQQVFTTCMGFVHSTEDANDLSQEVFISAFKHLQKFQQQSSFSTWLYRIAVNTSLNALRKKKKDIFQRFSGLFNSDKINPIEIAIEENDNPEQLLLTKELELRVSNELAKLSENQQTAFVLSKFDKLPQKEIAQIMGLTEGAVESLIQRAKANLVKNIFVYP